MEFQWKWREGEKEGTGEGQWNRAPSLSSESGENKLYSVVCEHEFASQLKFWRYDADNKYWNKLRSNNPIMKHPFFVARIFSSSNFYRLAVSRICRIRSVYRLTLNLEIPIWDKKRLKFSAIISKNPLFIRISELSNGTTLTARQERRTGSPDPRPSGLLATNTHSRHARPSKIKSQTMRAKWDSSSVRGCSVSLRGSVYSYESLTHPYLRF